MNQNIEPSATIKKTPAQPPRLFLLDSVLPPLVPPRNSARQTPPPRLVLPCTSPLLCPDRAPTVSNRTHPHRIALLLHESDSSFFFLMSGHVDGQGNNLAGCADGRDGNLAGRADGHGGNDDLLGRMQGQSNPASHTNGKDADRADTGGSGLADMWSLGGGLSRPAWKLPACGARAAASLQRVELGRRHLVL